MPSFYTFISKKIGEYKMQFVNNGFVATLALGSRPRQMELQGCRPKGSPGVKPRGSPGVTSHTPGSARKC